MWSKMKQKERVTVTVEFEVDRQVAEYIMKNSIERVINTAIRIVSGEPRAIENWQDVNMDDLKQAKPIITHMWSAVHNRLFAMGLHPPGKTAPVRLYVGDPDGD